MIQVLLNSSKQLELRKQYMKEIGESYDMSYLSNIISNNECMAEKELIYLVGVARMDFFVCFKIRGRKGSTRKKR